MHGQEGEKRYYHLANCDDFGSVARQELRGDDTLMALAKKGHQDIKIFLHVLINFT